MPGNLSQQERTIIQDQLRHEEVCISKYSEYARKTAGTALRNLFYELAQEEQGHHRTLSGLLGVSQAQQQGASQQQGPPQLQGPSQPQGLSLAQGPAQGQFQSQSQRSGAAFGGTAGGGAGSLMGQPAQSGQQPLPSFQETSRELIPMFRSETAQEFAGGRANEESSVRDMLMTEQFVSGSYDSAIFDSVSPQVRETLQHIQQDEQRHGERLRDYMEKTGLNRQ